MKKLHKGCGAFGAVLSTGLALVLASASANAADAAPAGGGGLSPAHALRIDDLRSLAMGEHIVVSDIPVDGRALDLELERFDIWTADGVFVHDNREVARPDITLLRGSVVGEADSKVVIGIGAHATNGFITSAGNTYSLSTGGLASTDAIQITNLAGFEFKGDRPGCGLNDANIDQYNPLGLPIRRDVADLEHSHAARGSAPCRVARVAIDSDWEWCSEVFGGNGLAGAEYALFLMAGISEIYQRDLNIRLVVPYLRTFSSNVDPYTGGTTPDPLDQVRDHWNANMTHIERETTHFFTGANTPYGGVAYVYALCNSEYGYGVSSYIEGSFPYPLVENSHNNWDLVVCAHELGHNFGTYHTHDGYEPPIDRCGIDCSGNLNGTIMSYCHTCPGGLMNIDLRFHPLVQDAIHDFLQFDVGCDLQPPAAAMPDSAGTAPQTPVDIFVLANDSGPGCAPVGIASFPGTTANGGTVTIEGWTNPTGNPTGRFLRYTPAAGFSGIDTFTYTNTNGDSAQVSIDVEGYRAPDSVINPQPGLAAEYYTIDPFTGFVPDFSGMTPVDETVVSNLNYASTNGNAVGSTISDNVGALFEGYVQVPQNGVYTFSLESDDGSVLYVGDELVVDNDGLHGMQTRSGNIGLEAGAHAISVGFFEAGGDAGLIFRWSGPGVFAGVVPASNLVHSGADDCGVADLAEPFGVLDLADISAFVSGFTGQDASADLAEPFGVWDLGDIAAFISAFGAGCP